MDEGVEETGDEVPLRHQSRAREKRGLEGKAKDRCSGIKSKLLLYLPAPRQETAQWLEKSSEHHRK